jgi:hypothetical protein
MWFSVMHVVALSFSQEDISILLANLPDHHLSRGSDGNEKKGDDVWDAGGDEGDAYCNLNRVIWGHKEVGGEYI